MTLTPRIRSALSSAALLAAAAYAVAVTATSAGCNSTCRPYADDDCEGNAPLICPETSNSSSHLLHGSDCGESASCVGPNAGCGVHAGCLKHVCKPDQASFCDGKDVVNCCSRSQTLEDERVTCANACVTAKTKTGALYAFCALGATPDPFCSARATCPEGEPRCGSGCDGDTWVSCLDAYATERLPCPAGSACSGGEPGHATCSADATFPRCVPSAAGSSFCDGERVVVCVFVSNEKGAGYTLGVQPCPKGCTEDSAAHRATCNP